MNYCLLVKTTCKIFKYAKKIALKIAFFVRVTANCANCVNKTITLTLILIIASNVQKGV